MNAGACAAGIVRLAVNVELADDEATAQPDLDALNAWVLDLDAAAARAAVHELALLASALLRQINDDHPGAVVDDFLTRWGLKLAGEATP